MKTTYSDFRVVSEMSLQWGDMDALGHINNIYFYRYFENVRVIYFDRMKTQMSPSNTTGAIIASSSCKYIRPLFYPDTILVGVKVSEMLSDRFIMSYKIFSQTQNRTCAIGDTAVVGYDFESKKKIEIQDQWVQIINQIEQGPVDERLNNS